MSRCSDGRGRVVFLAIMVIILANNAVIGKKYDHIYTALIRFRFLLVINESALSRDYDLAFPTSRS